MKPEIDKTRISTIIRIELQLRRKLYTSYIEEGRMDRETANHRYFCLQKALVMVEPSPNGVTFQVTLDDVIAEIETWIRTIQRETTAATLRGDGQRVAHLKTFITHFSPVPENRVVVKQTKLF